MLLLVVRTAQFILEIIFPKFCCGCDKLGIFLCHKCYERITFLNLPPQLSNILYVDQVIAAAEFSFPIDRLIKTLKYQSVQAIGLTCARLLYYAVNIPKADVITAVPLHPKRQRERRFNQAETIAQQLSKLIKKPYLPLLIKTKHTKNLARSHNTLNRQELVKESFCFNTDYLDHHFKSVLIIDDVVTTGSTIDACAKELKNNGFSQVIGLTVAHGS